MTSAVVGAKRKAFASSVNEVGGWHSRLDGYLLSGPNKCA